MNKLISSLLPISIIALTIGSVPQVQAQPPQADRNGDNYLGLATAIGESTDFVDAAIISKVKLLNLGSDNTLSIRPTAVFTDGEVDFRIPATIEWQLRNDLGELTGKVTPFAGAGAVIDSGGDADLLLTGGVDYSLTRNFTATASVNVLFLGDTDLDLIIGVGYNF